MRLPQTNDTITIDDATIPCDMANPALRIANILNAPPGTQNNPDTIPHLVNVNSCPSRSTNQLVKLCPQYDDQ